MKVLRSVIETEGPGVVLFDHPEVICIVGFTLTYNCACTCHITFDQCLVRGLAVRHGIPSCRPPAAGAMVVVRSSRECWCLV